MANWEDRLQSLVEAIRERFTRPHAVLLGVCAFGARKLGIPVAILRIVACVVVYYWPLVTLVAYIVARFFIEHNDIEA